MAEEYKTIVKFEVEDPKRVLDLYRKIPESFREVPDQQIEDEMGEGGNCGYLFYRILMDLTFWVKWDGFLVAEFGKALDRVSWMQVFGVSWTWTEECNE